MRLSRERTTRRLTPTPSSQTRSSVPFGKRSVSRSTLAPAARSASPTTVASSDSSGKRGGGSGYGGRLLPQGLGAHERVELDRKPLRVAVDPLQVGQDQICHFELPVLRQIDDLSQALDEQLRPLGGEPLFKQRGLPAGAGDEHGQPPSACRTPRPC